MKILFVASEMTSLAKVGGLGDVIASLPKALKKNGVDVSVILPFYETIRKKKLRVKKLGTLEIQLAKERQKAAIYLTKPPNSSVEVFLVENKKYLGKGPVYFARNAVADSLKETKRFVFFSKIVYELLNSPKKILPKFDIIHCHDWHTGALVSLLKNEKPVVFTIHNLGNQGAWKTKDIKQWLGEIPYTDKKVNFMAEGIINADIVTTVSSTYAKEITTKEYGAGLEKLLQKRSRQGKLIGILNGIDYGFWPPQKQKKTGSHSPVFGLVARLAHQKGIHLVTDIVPEFVEKNGVKFRFLGQGEPKNEKKLKSLKRSYPKNIRIKIGFDEKLAIDIYAQSDFFLIPSLFEPSGLGQMIAMRYGTVPIARATGGLKDSIIHKKTGFLFNKANSKALDRAMHDALRTYYDRKKFKKIIQNCKKQDFSWKKSAPKYVKLYRKLINK